MVFTMFLQLDQIWSSMLKVISTYVFLKPRSFASHCTMIWISNFLFIFHLSDKRLLTKKYRRSAGPRMLDLKSSTAISKFNYKTYKRGKLLAED